MEEEHFDLARSMILNSIGQKVNTPYGPYIISQRDADICLDGPITAQDMLYCTALKENHLPVRIPETEWFIHFSARSTPYSWKTFNYGRPLERAWAMGEAGSFSAIKHFEADCSLPLEKQFLVQFAWPVTGLIFNWADTGKGSFILPESGQSYALLFQVRGGCVGQNATEGFEALFRVCDEINVIPLMAGYRNYTVRNHHFDSLIDLIEWANATIASPTLWPAPLPDEWQSLEDVELFQTCLPKMLRWQLSRDLDQGLNLEELKMKYISLLG